MCAAARANKHLSGSFHDFFHTFLLKSTGVNLFPAVYTEENIIERIHGLTHQIWLVVRLDEASMKAIDSYYLPPFIRLTREGTYVGTVNRFSSAGVSPCSPPIGARPSRFSFYVLGDGWSSGTGLMPSFIGDAVPWLARMIPSWRQWHIYPCGACTPITVVVVGRIRLCCSLTMVHTLLVDVSHLLALCSTLALA